MTTQTLSNNLSNTLPHAIKLFSVQKIAMWTKSLILRIHTARMITQQRRMLAQLDSDQLRDMGISQFDADIESAKGFWDIPENLK